VHLGRIVFGLTFICGGGVREQARYASDHAEGNNHQLLPLSRRSTERTATMGIPRNAYGKNRLCSTQDSLIVSIQSENS
jgi:hypothetical protein